MDITYRVKYYLSSLYDIYNSNKKIIYKIPIVETDMIIFNKIQAINNNMLYSDNFSPQIKYYVYNLRSYFSVAELDTFNVLVALGDINIKLNKYCLSKTRPINNPDNKNILLNLNTIRHWGALKDVDKYDIDFSKKTNKLIWRGSSTGKNNGNHRFTFVKKFQNHENKNIDIKFSHLCQVPENKNDEYILDTMSVAEQLKAKFIISLEGNDVATNLKWIMYSNSVVIMPKPTICSWFMEDHLKPNVHYIEIKPDFSDLEKVYEWCINNQDICLTISKNAKEYVKEFLNDETELIIINQVLNIYCKTIQIKE